MSVKENPLKAALARGEVQVGTWIMMIRNPAVLGLLKSIGLNYARLDLEHTSMSIETVGDMAILARALDFPLVVRPPVGNREWITRLLDSGVWNFHVPQVNTLEQAQEIVNAAYHYPVGNRGTWEPGPQNEYTYPGDPTGSLGFLNSQIHISVMLESIEAFRHLDEIAGLKGIDAISVGPADLAQELGVYDTPDEKRIIAEYQEQVRQAALKHNKILSAGVWSIDEGEYWIKAGAKIINYQTDTLIIRQALKAAVDTFASVASRP
jgi:2-keto-3-deoxy-L-rhamnonate aldolase RhmA